MKTHVIVRLIVDVDYLANGVDVAKSVLEKEGFDVSRGPEYDLIAEKNENRTH